MARNLATLAFLAVAAVASAQDRQINIVDSPEMMAVVEKRTALVDKATALSTEQTAQVKDVFLRVERQMTAIHMRLDMAEPKMSLEDKEQDMKAHYAHWDQWTNDQLSHILNEGQFAKWVAVNK